MNNINGSVHGDSQPIEDSGHVDSTESSYTQINKPRVLFIVFLSIIIVIIVIVLPLTIKKKPQEIEKEEEEEEITKEEEEKQEEEEENIVFEIKNKINEILIYSETINRTSMIFNTTGSSIRKCDYLFNIYEINDIYKAYVILLNFTVNHQKEMEIGDIRELNDIPNNISVFKFNYDKYGYTSNFEFNENMNITYRYYIYEFIEKIIPKFYDEFEYGIKNEYYYIKNINQDHNITIYLRKGKIHKSESSQNSIQNVSGFDLIQNEVSEINLNSEEINSSFTDKIKQLMNSISFYKDPSEQ